MTARPPAGYGYLPAASLPSVAPRPTLRDVATQAGVHPATASRALNEATRSLVRPATVARSTRSPGA
jgi:LacI family transcriptional regulator